MPENCGNVSVALIDSQHAPPRVKRRAGCRSAPCMREEKCPADKVPIYRNSEYIRNADVSNQWKNVPEAQ